MKTVLCIPTLNAGSMVHDLVDGIRNQTHQVGKILVIDSSSHDNTAALFHEAGAKVHVIPRVSFNHGGTRQLALDMEPDADFIFFITQDVIFASSDVFEKLLKSFSCKCVGAAYGRQLPAINANPISQHARMFNYLPVNMTKSIEDVPRLGIKTAFFSDSLSVYRRSALMSIGGFPSNIIFGEDTYVAAKLILNNWKISYCADAKAYHSHNLRLMEEFRRYFDIGVFHSNEKWFIESFGKAEGEGFKFVMSELRFLAKVGPWFIPSAILRTALKFLGYHLGKHEQYFSLGVKLQLSLNRNYWKDHNAGK